VLRVGAHQIADLRGLSTALKASKPGDRVEVHYRRGAEERSVELTLSTR